MSLPLGALLALALVAPLGAAEHFACDCAAGADPSCVPGDDGAAGTTPASAWRTYDRAQDQWASLAAGDAIRFCRGGVFPITGSTQWVNGSCTALAPCVLADYAPAWGSGDEPRPRLEQSAGNGLDLREPPPVEPESGYRIAALELACTACDAGHWGVVIGNDVDDVELADLEIHGFDIGVHLTGSGACGPAAGCDARNSRVTLRDSLVRDNGSQGWLGAGDALVLAGNRFVGNGGGTVFEHNVYLSQSGGATTGIQVVGNELHRSARDSDGRCVGGSFAMHGEHQDVLIADNWVHEDIGLAWPTCWGIGVTPSYASPEGFTRVTVRGNRLENLGNIALALASCVDCVVENNLVVQHQDHGTLGIAAPAVTRALDDAALAALVVRNNSIFIGAAGGTGIRLGGEGEGHQLVSNALQTTATASWACFDADLSPAAYALADHNVCGYPPGPFREWELGSGSLAAWQAASGHDASSLAADPGFAAPAPPLHDLRAASPAAAMVDAGHPTASAPTDVDGAPRGADPDAGAHELAPCLFCDGFESGDLGAWSGSQP